MKIVLGSDHGAYELKEEVKKYLQEKNIEIVDAGTDDSETSVDYPDFAKNVVEQILNKKVDSGILMCGTGIGMSITANRYKGIRATLCTNEFMAEMSKKHNDSNVLVLGGRILEVSQALKIVEVWLNNEFEGDRHQRRLDKIEEM